MADREQSDEIEEVLFGLVPNGPSAIETAPAIGARLEVIEGRATQSEVHLTLPAILGRGPDATVLIKHPTVSRVHCEITDKDGILVVRDLRSKNGTFVGGQRISEAELRPGDILTVGPLTFRAIYEPSEKAPSAPAISTPAAAPAPSPPPAAGDLSDDDIDQFLSGSPSDV
jgi:predicted component of type VI protein secretion system